ncbi:hypothetical protein PA08_0966 [Cutibacterium modestum P08]|nr:hypothetical protein PA08_0966 [Cutibacterium modestum P08]
MGSFELAKAGVFAAEHPMTTADSKPTIQTDHRWERRQAGTVIGSA